MSATPGLAQGSLWKVWPAPAALLTGVLLLLYVGNNRAADPETAPTPEEQARYLEWYKQQAAQKAAQGTDSTPTPKTFSVYENGTTTTAHHNQSRLRPTRERGRHRKKWPVSSTGTSMRVRRGRPEPRHRRRHPTMWFASSRGTAAMVSRRHTVRPHWKSVLRTMS